MTTQNPEAINTVYNTAFGYRTTLTQLVEYLKEYLGAFNSKILEVKI